jgi:hypothetical protein
MLPPLLLLLLLLPPHLLRSQPSTGATGSVTVTVPVGSGSRRLHDVCCATNAAAAAAATAAAAAATAAAVPKLTLKLRRRAA